MLSCYKARVKEIQTGGLVSSVANVLVGNRELPRTYFQMRKGLANHFSEQHPPTREGEAFKQRVMKENYVQYGAV